MGDLVIEVDVAVVGGGPGGYSAAFRCAELGLETVVVDAAKRLGGACLWEGCVPSKALLHVRALIEDAERAREVGIDFGEPRVSLDPLRKWKAERVVGRLARGLAAVAKARGVEVIGGRAVFESSRELRVEGDEPQKVRFKHAVIATGSAPASLPGLALASDRVIDSTAALELADVPDRLLVIGGGHIRLEPGQIYAVGDVTGEPMLAHRAMRQGKVAAEVIAGRPAAFDNVVVPAVVFTDPEVAWCGLTESQAAREGRTVKVAKREWAASGRALTLGRSDGLTKVVADPDTGRVLGVGIVGPGAGELIAAGALAVETALTVDDLAATIHTHPTLSETLMEAAESLLRG